MRKCAYLDLRRSNGWPRLEELEPYFLKPRGQCWALKSGNDNAGLAAEGVDGTEDLDPNDGRIDVDLDMWGHSDLGVLLIYSKWGRGVKEMCSSKGNLTRLRERMRAGHAVAGWVVHPPWDGLGGGQGIHGNGWRASNQD